METSRMRLYLFFMAAFLIMHLTGVFVEGLPYIYNAIITFSIVLLFLLLFEWRLQKRNYLGILYDLGLHKATFLQVLPGIVVSAVLVLIYPLFGYFFHANIILHEDWFLNLAGLCLTGGLAEEMLFRGFLFRRLRENMPFKKAALTAMVLFATAHLVLFTYFDWQIALFSTLLSVFIAVPLAYLFEKGNNTVWSPAIVHTTVRTIGMAVTTSEQNFLKLTLIWMVGSMVIPYVVLVFYKDFRSHYFLRWD
jgi:membrane protease YdiL (CAAX protease family)